MGKRMHYPAEIKWKAVQLKEEGYTNREIMKELGIRNETQIKTWMRWYRTGQTYRFSQPVGKQYTYGKGPAELTELEKKDLEIRYLKAKVAVLEKLKEIQRRWGQK